MADRYRELAAGDRMARSEGVIALALSALCLAGCRSGPVQRTGERQATIVERTYRLPVAALRETVLRIFAARPRWLPFPFKDMMAVELKPPSYASEWAATFVDPGEFLKPYKQLPASERDQDLLLREATGDLYWNSEYTGQSGAVKFQCEFILHFKESAGGTTVQVFEKVPSVWPGMYWTFGHSGPGWYRDIRFVEPTVQDRVSALDMLEELSAVSRQ
jgi:hypothetical protein